jgi:hypothetical protein
VGGESHKRDSSLAIVERLPGLETSASVTPEVESLPERVRGKSCTRFDDSRKSESSLAIVERFPRLEARLDFLSPSALCKLARVDRFAGTLIAFKLLTFIFDFVDPVLETDRRGRAGEELCCFVPAEETGAAVRERRVQLNSVTSKAGASFLFGLGEDVNERRVRVDLDLDG